jgi:hypothetical protein
MGQETNKNDPPLFRRKQGMGYESRLYVVEKSMLLKDSDIGLRFAEVIARFDLSKVYAVSDIFRTYPKTDSFIYEDNGNTRIIDDCYGETLTEIPIKDAIEILENAASKDDYRRYAPIIALLRGFDLNQWGDLVVLHYGY